MDFIISKTLWTIFNVARFGGPPSLSTYYLTKKCPEDEDKEKCENIKDYTLYAAMILILLALTFRKIGYVILLGLGPSLLIYYFTKTCEENTEKENCEKTRNYILYSGIACTVIITTLFWGFVF